MGREGLAQPHSGASSVGLVFLERNDALAFALVSCVPPDALTGRTAVGSRHTSAAILETFTALSAFPTRSKLLASDLPSSLVWAYLES